MMGEYVDGKWKPTWGDDQFGVVDSAHAVDNRITALTAEMVRLEAEIASRVVRTERMMSLVQENLDLKADNQRLCEGLAEIAKLNTTYHPIGDRFDDGMVGGHQDAVDIAKATLKEVEK